MTLLVVSTFIAVDDGFRRMRDELTQLRGRVALEWLVSSPDASLLAAVQDLPWCRPVVAPDRSYAEGWNNALALLTPADRRPGHWVSLLGAGDRIVGLPPLQVLDAGRVHCGSTVRVSSAGRLTHLPSVRPTMFWLRIGAWTPACLFPAGMFQGFTLPVDCRIGADIALFFHARALGLPFDVASELAIEMDEGGLSTDPRRGLDDYRRIAKAAGTGFMALHAGHWLRWLRARLSSN